MALVPMMEFLMSGEPTIWKPDNIVWFQLVQPFENWTLKGWFFRCFRYYGVSYQMVTVLPCTSAHRWESFAWVWRPAYRSVAAAVVAAAAVVDAVVDAAEADVFSEVLQWMSGHHCTPPSWSPWQTLMANKDLPTSVVMGCDAMWCRRERFVGDGACVLVHREVG